MKKLICIVLSLLLLCGVACADTLADGGKSTATATMTVNTPEPEPETVVEVVVNWGDMEFSYDDGVISAVNGSNTVTVTNNSNVEVTVTCELSGLADGISGTVDGKSAPVSEVLDAKPEEGSADAHTFTVEFAAEDTFDPTRYANGEEVTLGSVTVSVAAAEK